MTLEVIILAAGQGTRMKSSRPKVLHEVGGRPMLGRVIDTALALKPGRVHVVIGSGADLVQQTIGHLFAQTQTPICFAMQEEQRGTGHAVLQAVDQAQPPIDGQTRCLILNGDAPLLDLESLNNLLAVVAQRQAALGILTALPDNPYGLGRIMRDAGGNIVGIVEEKDASDAQRQIAEINSGIMLCQAEPLRRWLNGLETANSQGEYYLTDIVGKAVADGLLVCGELAASPKLLVGVNSRTELAHAEKTLQRIQTGRLMENGVTLRDPSRVDIRGQLEHGEDCEIDINVVFEGKVILGSGVSVGPNCVIRDSTIGDHSRVNANSVIEEAALGANCQVGPFARLRPGTRFDDRVRIGNFVETKNVTFGTDSKANHLAYVGDSKVGNNVNIGAGVITCNYDGANKHQTVIGDDVFVGSDAQLVAPVKIGDGATIGAGATITRDVPAGNLAITRAPYKAIAEWRRPVKKPKD